MKLVFDASTSPVLAATLHGFIRHRGHAAAHVRDGGAGGDDGAGRTVGGASGDADIHAALGDALLVSGDARLARNRALRLGCRDAGLRMLLLSPGFLRLRMHEQAAALVARWPEIEALDGAAGPFLQEVPAAAADRLRALPL